MSDCGDVWYESDARFPPPKIVGRLVPIERAEKAEAAIQRVRELLAHPRDYRGNGSEWNECRDAVLRALDGADDE